MNRMGRVFTLLSCILTLQTSLAWDNEELELFDLVEEVKNNFYDVLGVEQSAAVADIKRAYRRLSVKYHPDKNKEPDAEEKFRQIVAIYEVLKDSERRKQYDNILIYGLPDWKQPVFYYRQVRKLGLIELSILLLIILTVGHFLVVWSIYLEKKFEMQEVFQSRKKKEKKGKKKLEREKKENEKLEAFQEELNALPKPQLRDLVPLQMMRAVWWIIISSPTWFDVIKSKLRKKKELPSESEDTDGDADNKTQRKRQRVEIPDLDFKPELVATVAPVLYTEQIKDVGKKTEDEPVTSRVGKEWTDDEISLLAKAVARFPAGVPARWEKIAEFVGRSVSEVTKMSKQIKTGYALTVDPSAQGITGHDSDKVSLKKGSKPSDNIISERLEFGNPSVDDLNAIKKNKKLPNTNKDRTLMIKTIKPETLEHSNDNESCQGCKDDNVQHTSGNKLVLDNKEVDDHLVWSQNQQKILEWALTQYPKGSAERWDKIAEHIPGKTRDDCIARFKYLADMIKKKKATQGQISTKMTS